MKENAFQAGVIRDIKKQHPGCVVLKNDCNYLQGFPDLTILYGGKWATLECKRSENASKQPNQEHYVNKHRVMSFSAFISPENKEAVLSDLQRALSPARKTRNPRSK